VAESLTERLSRKKTGKHPVKKEKVPAE
jgi:hypothetical protein